MTYIKAQGMQFGWLFALIIGGVILFLAISFSGQIIGTGTQQTQAELTRSIDTLLNPFASIEGAKVSLSKPVSLPEKTEVNFSCSSRLDSQTMSLKLKRGEKPFTYQIKNKYIFSESFNEKELWVFAKPFEMPWRVDDLIYIISKKYCFINPPENIKKELQEINSSKIIVSSSSANCKDYMTVCWIGKCNISVTDSTVTPKGGNPLFYLDDSTMYAAIFGPSQYNCNIERLRTRLGVQTEIFIAKTDILIQQGCIEAQPLKQELSDLRSLIVSKDFALIKSKAVQIDNDNMISCPIY